MRRPVVIILVALVVVLVGVAAVLFNRYREKSAAYTDLKSRAEMARAGYAEAFKAVSEIQDSLNAIALSDTTVQMLAHDLQSEQKPTEAHRREALERIAVIQASIERNKARVRQLESALHKSGVKVAGLQKMIDALHVTISEKERAVAQLTGRVDSLQTQVTGLQTTVAEDQQTIRVKDLTIQQKQRDLATVLYIVGTKKELDAAGVVVAKGGVLGLGRTLLQSGHYNESLFTPLDTDQETVIPTGAAKVQVLSAQPAGSYEVQEVDGKAQIHILDAKEFCKVKHVVIMTR